MDELRLQRALKPVMNWRRLIGHLHWALPLPTRGEFGAAAYELGGVRSCNAYEIKSRSVQIIPNPIHLR